MSNYDLFINRLNTSTKISKEKLIENKINTFKRALNSSYNSELVRDSNNNEFQVLISKIDTMPKISRKSFSTLKENFCEVGSVIYWIEKDSHWIIVEESDTEHAIFQAYIDKAIYKLEWKDLETGITYSQWACAKGPDQTTISDGVKNSITFDRYTDSLYLKVPANTDGIDLMKRYESIIVNGKKWNIEVIDNTTDPRLIELQLKETSIDRDVDTETMVNGKVEINFLLTTALDNITELTVGKVIDLNPVLYKNGVIEEIPNIITVKNCINNNGTITFNNLGTATVTVYYATINKYDKFTINVVAESIINIETRMIIGSETLKGIAQSTYTFINLQNGVNIPIAGSWLVDTNYVSIISQNSDNITLKTINKTGTITLSYVYESNTYTKVIEIIPMFGGN